MARKKQDDGGTAVAETEVVPLEIESLVPPVAPPVFATAADVRSTAWRFHLKCKWAIPYVVIAGVDSEQKARAELHRMLDLAITKIEATR